jgi:hypothetical protein
MNYLAVSVAIGLLMISPQAVGAARLQPAGGANQADAVEGALNQTLFNGEVRLRASSLRAATDAERDDVSPPDGQKVLVLTCTMSNGTHSTFNGVFEYALADAGGVVVVVAAAESRYIEPNPPPDAPPGGAWRENVSFIVPESFAAVKLVITQSVKTNNADVARAFRLRLDPANVR